MSAQLATFILIHLIVLVFFIETLRRVSKRTNEYKLKDTRETIPFGFIRLRHLVIFYVLGYMLWLVVSILLYLTFIDSSTSLSIRNGQSPGTIKGIDLHL